MNEKRIIKSKEGGKRIREADYEEQEIEEIIFGPSKRIIRSPTYKQKELPEENKMEDLQNMIKELILEVRKNTTQLEKVTDELASVKEELKTNEQKWNREKEQLNERIDKLEAIVEKQEKDRKRNNTVIRGIELDKNNPNEDLQNKMFEELGVEAKTKRVTNINNKNGKMVYLVEWISWEEKQKIMANKYKLKENNKTIFIEHDMTKEEERIQYEIRNIVREERKNNPRAAIKIGYQKITINGTEYKWSKEENGVIGYTTGFPKN